MTRRTRTIVAAAAGLMFSISSVAVAQNQPGQRGQQGQQDRPNVIPAPIGLADDQQSQQQGQQAQQQFEQQIQQIAQSPGQNGAEKLFVLHAALGNQFEMQLAQQAQQKSDNPQVERVARQIIQDHQQANQRLQGVARQLNVDLPQNLPQMKQQELKIITSLPADQFEKTFITMMQAAHAAELIKYRSVAQMSQNEQVKEYAQQTLPTLSQHYDQLQQAAVALGLPSGGPEAVPAAGRMNGSRPGQQGQPGQPGQPGQQGQPGQPGNRN